MLSENRAQTYLLRTLIEIGKKPRHPKHEEHVRRTKKAFSYYFFTISPNKKQLNSINLPSRCAFNVIRKIDKGQRTIFNSSVIFLSILSLFAKLRPSLIEIIKYGIPYERLSPCVRVCVYVLVFNPAFFTLHSILFLF